VAGLLVLEVLLGIGLLTLDYLKLMSDFAWKIVFGTALFAFGLKVFIKPRWYAFLRDTYLDFSDHNHFLGVVFMLLGSAFLWLVIRHEVRNRKKR
jgi:hypothetical protein